MNVRPLTPGDAAAVAELAGADEAALRGTPSRLQEADVLAWWSHVELEPDSWLFEEAGTPVAAGWFHPYGEKGAFFGIVAQGAKGRGLGARIAELGEARSREHRSVKAHTVTLSEDAAAAALFRRRGYAEARRFYEMAIELDRTPAVPRLPGELLLDEFQQRDARAFAAAVDEAFQDHWEWQSAPFDEWWDKRRGEERDADGPLWFVVRDGDEIAAAVRNETNRNGGGYVALLGVRRGWRGLGLGKALLYRSFAEFWARGVTRVTLGVDADSPTGATKLYERVGMEVESCMVVFEKALT